jgi:lipopolysaccharide export LptBFGC system permease protein LptF
MLYEIKTFTIAEKTYKTTQHLHERMAAREISAKEVGLTIKEGKWIFNGKSEKGEDKFRIVRDFDNDRTTNFVVVAAKKNGTFQVLTTWNRGRLDNGAK